MIRSRPRAAGLLFLAGCLALVVLITMVTPDPATQARRRYDDVGIGAPGELPHAVVRATAVRVTRSVAQPYGPSFDSAVNLVLVDVTTDVRGEQMRFSKVWLRTRDDHDYEPRSEFISQGLALTQPGFTRRGTLVFEVPVDRTPESRLIVDPDGAAYDVFSDAVRIDLGLTDQTPVLPGPLPVANSVLEVTR